MTDINFTNETIETNKEAEDDFRKIRIEALGLSTRTTNALSNNGHMRTVGGIIRKKESDMLEIKGLGVRGVEEIKRLLNNSFGISMSDNRWQVEETRGLLSNFYGKSEDIKLGVSSNISVESSNLPQKNLSYKAFPTFRFTDKDDIVSIFSSYFGISKNDIKSPSRRKEIVEVRDLIAYFLREYGRMSFPAIGRLLGNRDHTTIIHSYRKIQKNIISNQDFESKFAELISKAKLVKERKVYVEHVVIPQIIDASRFMVATRRSRIKYNLISKRDEKVIELYREGLTLENIGGIIGVTRERARQIAEKTIRQTAINESISKGITIDADIMLSEEKKKRANAKRKTEDISQGAQNGNKNERRWSRYYLSCKLCGTTEIPHVKQGLCEMCIGHFRGERREQIIFGHGNKCDSCSLFRNEAITKYGRDFYIKKDKSVLCRKCFLADTGKTLGGHKNYSWSRFHPQCISCGTTSSPHFKKGLCEKCGNKVTAESRDLIINNHGGKCDFCGIERAEIKNKFGRDLNVTKDRKVLCRRCFMGELRSKHKF